MTAAEYRQKAADLMTANRVFRITEEELRQAEIWARLAVSAAISENGQVTRNGK